MPSPPDSLTSLRVSSPSLSRLAAITTLIPSLASAIAVVLPVPELEPVTIATFCILFAE
jgi:hypothetical protein